MSDIIDAPSTPPGSGPPDPQRPVCTAEEIAAGKALAIVSYVCNFFHLPFFLVPLIMRGDRLSLYHAKQCLLLWLTVLVLSLPVGILAFIFTVATAGLGVCIVIPLSILIWIAGVIINIMGIVNAAAGRCEPLPVIGPFAERWFAGITVISRPGATP